MKLSLSSRTLNILLIGTTVINYILLVAYVFLLISATVIDNYVLFLFSIPAYILSKSWFLLLFFFGFEGCLLTYFWLKKRRGVQLENKEEYVSQLINEDITDEQLYDFAETTEFSDDEDDTLTDLLSIFEDAPEILSNESPPRGDIEDRLKRPEELDASIQSPLSDFTASSVAEQPTHAKTAAGKMTRDQAIDFDEALELLEEEPGQQMTEAELDFDRRWTEAVKHAEIASNKKKVDRQPPRLITGDGKPVEVPKEPSILPSSGSSSHNKKSPIRNNTRSRASIKKKLKRKEGDLSVLKEEHKELFNEIALNNWIYEHSRDRERIGKYKFALDETRFRERDLHYLLAAGVLFKLTIPFPGGAFNVFTIYEGEAKKIIKDYLFKLCKKHKLPLSQKTVRIKDYASYGLEKQSWRFDFAINNELLGQIWLSNFLLEPDSSSDYSLAPQRREELKALLAASQLQYEDRETIAMILTDYKESVAIITSFIKTLGKGQGKVLAVGEKDFESKFLKVLKSLSPTQ